MDKNINMSAICFLLFFIIGYLNGRDTTDDDDDGK